MSRVPLVTSFCGTIGNDKKAISDIVCLIEAIIIML